MKSRYLFYTLAGFLFFPLLTQSQSYQVAQNNVLELSFTSSIFYQNPFRDVNVDVIVENPDGQKTIYPTYWSGNQKWKFRFSSANVGTYTYQTHCDDSKKTGLHDQQGTIHVNPYHGSHPLYQHGPLQIQPNAKIIKHADGTPFLWLADSWWHGMTQRFRWPEDFHTLTIDRKQKGFSVIQFAIGFPCDIAPFDPRGSNEAGFPMSQDYETINPAYFDHTDLRIANLVDQGLVPNIVGSWGYYLPWMGVDTLKLYWRYLLARYGAYPVTWTVAGESTLIWYLTEDDKREERVKTQKDGWSEIANYIKQHDPFNRILTVHPGPASGRFQPLTDMDPIDIIMVQPGHNGWETIPRAIDHLKQAQTKYPDRPVMQGEVCFEGMHGGGSGPKVQRILFWTNMLSGAIGHSYGVDAIWQFNTKEKLFGKSPSGHIWGNAPWEEAYQWEGSTFVGLGKKILENYEWWRFEPHPEWVTPSADNENTYMAYAAGIEDEIRMIYFPKGILPWGQTYALNDLNPNKIYNASFIDPRTGERYPLPEPIKNTTEWHVPHAPILQDWLLVLKPE